MEKPSEKPSAMSAKRGPTCSLSGSSSSEGEGSDHEDIPPSPCSSTSSEPTYVRPPGFKHHGQEFKVIDPKPKVNNIRIKRKIKRQSMMKDVLPVSHAHQSHVISPPQVVKVTKEKEPVPVLHPGGMKTKIRKEPIPMRLRALPQSFWQQPNTVNSAPPGSMYSVLPPLCKMEQSNSDLAEIRPVTPPSSESETFDLKEMAVISEHPEVKKEPAERKDALVDKDCLKLDLGRERDVSKERDYGSRESRDISPRDREVSPRSQEVSPRDMDISPRDKELSPRDTREISPRDRDLTPRGTRELGKERELYAKEKEIAREKDGVRELRENGTSELPRESRPVAPPPDVRKKVPRPPPRIVKISPANTELLAKLFEGIDGDSKKKGIRRGRPKREFTGPHVTTLAAATVTVNTSNNNNSSSSASNVNSTASATTATTTTHSHQFLLGDDPYMIENIAEGLLPTLSRQSSGPTSHLSIVSIRGDNDRMLSLPSLSVEQNHMAILSEVVKAL